MISQWINNAILESNSKIVSKIFTKLRKVIVKGYDPLVKHNIYGTELYMPMSHDIPFIIKSYPVYSSNLGRITSYIQKKYSDLSCIDIGANIGDSVAIIRSFSNVPILCIEGEEYFYSILERNIEQFMNVKTVKCFVGANTEEIESNVSILNGTAHLESSRSTQKNIFTKTLNDILEDNTEFSKSKLIKVDTDGFDCIILRGARQFLSQQKPVLFFEYDPYFAAIQNDDAISIFSYLEELGYTKLVIWENSGRYMTSVNLSNKPAIEDLHNYFCGRKGAFYADICVFHYEDEDLFSVTRQNEIKFFSNTIELK